LILGDFGALPHFNALNTFQAGLCEELRVILILLTFLTGHHGMIRVLRDVLSEFHDTQGILLTLPKEIVILEVGSQAVRTGLLDFRLSTTECFT